MYIEITNQSVYLFTQSIVNCIRYEIDKDFCPTEGCISVEKDKKVIYPDAMKLKTVFYIRFLELGKRETETPRESGQHSGDPSSRPGVSNDTSQGCYGENINPTHTEEVFFF